MLIGPSWDQAPFLLVCSRTSSSCDVLAAWMGTTRSKSHSRLVSGTHPGCLSSKSCALSVGPRSFSRGCGDMHWTTHNKQASLIKTSTLRLKTGSAERLCRTSFPSCLLPRQVMRVKDLYLSQSCPSVRCKTIAKPAAATTPPAKTLICFG